MDITRRAAQDICLVEGVAKCRENHPSFSRTCKIYKRERERERERVDGNKI